MHVNLFNFTKKNNSTKRPADNSAVTLTGVKFKEPVNMRKPDLVFQSLAEPFNTYKYLSFKGRYYFIDVWEYNSPCWIAHCHLDTLATYFDDIIDMHVLVERCNKYMLDDSYITDNEVIPTLKMNNTRITFNTHDSIRSFADGSIVIEVAGEYTQPSASAGNNILMSVAQYAEFLQKLQQLASGFLSDIINPFSCILKVTWYPFSVNSMLSGQSYIDINSVSLGSWSIQISTAVHYYIDNVRIRKQVNVKINRHSQSNALGYWVDHDAREVTVVTYPYGTVTFKPRAQDSAISITYEIDVIGNRALFRVYKGSYEYINAMTSYGVELPFVFTHRSDFDVLNGILGVTGSLLSASTGNFSALQTSLVGVKNIVEGSSKTIQTTGAVNSIISYLTYEYCTVSESALIAPNRSDVGYVYMKISTIKTLPNGYIRCINANFDKGSYEDNQEINNYMNGGFFYE